MGEEREAGQGRRDVTSPAVPLSNLTLGRYGLQGLCWGSPTHPQQENFSGHGRRGALAEKWEVTRSPSPCCLERKSGGSGRETLEPLLGNRLPVPAPLPRGGRPGSSHLKWVPGSLGEGLALLQLPVPGDPASPTPAPPWPSPS